jgi:hypothetical protein
LPYASRAQARAELDDEHPECFIVRNSNRHKGERHSSGKEETREVEAAWRAEFKRMGETQLRDALNIGVGIADEPKRQAAFRWLGDEAQSRRLREEKTPLCPLDLLAAGRLV